MIPDQERMRVADAFNEVADVLERQDVGQATKDRAIDVVKAAVGRLLVPEDPVSAERRRKINAEIERWYDELYMLKTRRRYDASPFHEEHDRDDSLVQHLRSKHAVVRLGRAARALQGRPPQGSAGPAGEGRIEAGKHVQRATLVSQ